MPRNPITLEGAREFRRIRAERQRLEREARTLAKREQAISDGWLAYLRDLETQTSIRAGLRFSVGWKRKVVSWLGVASEALGATRCEEIRAEQPLEPRLEVTEIGETE